jgi:hypothetical protein
MVGRLVAAVEVSPIGGGVCDGVDAIVGSMVSVTVPRDHGSK